MTVLERTNVKELDPAALPWAPDLIVADLSFISLHKVLPALMGAATPRFDCLTMVKPQFEVGRPKVGKGGVVRDAGAAPRGAGRRWARARAGAGRLGHGLRVLRAARAQGQPRELRLAGRGRTRRAPSHDLDAGRAEGRAVSAPKSVRCSRGATRRRRPRPCTGWPSWPTRPGSSCWCPARRSTSTASRICPAPTFDADPLTADLAVVLGGDGTILTTMRRFAGRDVPVFAVNFGAVGFLSTVESGDLDEALGSALRGEYEVLPLPVLSADVNGAPQVAVNDISLHRRQDLRVAELAFSVAGQELGEVRCDGLVVATPAGSTGYNLANGGPVLAWGVEGFVVSFIAPHTLTARALVVAPDDVLEVVQPLDRASRWT